jgi:ABC-type ATPase with predicted acetyltransferase domain
MLLNVAYSVPPKRNSVRASLVMDHFGISADIAERVLARDLEIPLEAGDIVLLTGGSGSGKSSLLRSLVAQLEHESTTPPSPLIHLQHLDLGQQILIDALPLEFDESLQLLASCGLGEAQLLLRTPQELSDGQRYRFALALAIALRPRWIVADEFAALLDRTTAQVIAHNIRRLADRTGIGFLLATAQNDIHQDLEADIHVTCELDGQIDVLVARTDTATIPFTNAPAPPPRKKKEPPSASTPTSGSASPPSATGRTSLGGIIAATTSD